MAGWIPAQLVLVSVDDHICEPADMFDAHVPDAVPRPCAARRGGARRRAAVVLRRAPRAEPRAERGGGQAAGDVQRRPAALRGHACRLLRRHARVLDMSAGGQLAGLNFPNWTGFSGQVLSAGPDRDVNLVMIRAYNDWHVDEWCGAYPDRFIPCGIVPLFDPDEAAAEVHRLAAKGVSRHHVLGEPGRARDAEHPLRARGTRCSPRAATRAPCCAATSARRRSRRRRRPDAPPPVPMSLSSVMAIYTLGDLLWSDLWQRFPDLRFALTEGDIGWIPYFLQRAEHSWRGTTAGCGTTRRRAAAPPSCSTTRSCAASSRTRSACSCSTASTSPTSAGSPTTRTRTARGPTRPSTSPAVRRRRRRHGRRDHPRQRDAALPLRPVRDPTAGAVHGRGTAGRGRRGRHHHPRRPTGRRARPRRLAAAHDPTPMRGRPMTDR